MNFRKRGSNLMALVMTVLLSMASGLAFAADGTQRKQANGAMTPELAAKREMVRKQQEQRITPEKRKKAVEALKEERLKVYRAKQSVQQSTPVTIDGK